MQRWSDLDPLPHKLANPRQTQPDAEPALGPPPRTAASAVALGWAASPVQRDEHLLHVLTADLLLFGLLRTGQIKLRAFDGWQEMKAGEGAGVTLDPVR